MMNGNILMIGSEKISRKTKHTMSSPLVLHYDPSSCPTFFRKLPSVTLAYPELSFLRISTAFVTAMVVDITNADKVSALCQTLL